MSNLRPGEYIRSEIRYQFNTIKEALEFCRKYNIDEENIIPMFGIRENEPIKFGVIEEYPFTVPREDEDESNQNQV